MRSAFLDIRGCLFHGGHDVRIGGAAADIAAHIFADVVVIAGMALVHAGNRRHDLSGRTVAALEGILVDEGPLHRMQLAVCASPSMVVISWPSATSASVRQESTRRPPISTVQAPHWP